MTRLAGIGAAVLAFASAIEPNLVLRYGPVVAIVTLILSNPRRLRLGWTEVLLGLFVVWIGYSQLWSVAPERYLVNALTLVSSALSFVAVRAAIDRGVNLFVVFVAYVSGNFVALAMTSWQLVANGEAQLDGDRVTQAGVLNVNHVAYGLVASIALVVLLWRSSVMQQPIVRVLTITLLVFLVAGVLATGTRSALLAILCLAAWLVIRWLGGSLRALTVVVVAWSVFVSAGWLDRVLELVDFGERGRGGLSGRLDIWPVARQLWDQDWLLGSGLGAVRSATPDQLASHNTILETGSTLGLVGLVVFFAFLVLSQRDRLGEIPDSTRDLRLGVVIATLTPIVLSGIWEYDASGWMALALLGQPFIERSTQRDVATDGRGALLAAGGPPALVGIAAS
ncbi:O-antigen ligase family protein [Curtobacterium citreum]|jgi:O-antigen ligase|uniref:O-antigen ligase family protein n=1 Tax=Curtobacterium citreum TaxID=2036 RepID=A0ABU8Y684_9MICO